MAVSKVKKPSRGRFGSETVKGLYRLCVTNISQRTQASKCPFGCNVYVAVITAVAVGQRQRHYFGVRSFTQVLLYLVLSQFYIINIKFVIKVSKPNLSH